MQLHDRRLFWWFLGLSIWGLFTISLATWWYVFVMREIQREYLVAASPPAEFARKVTMIKYEGLALVVSLLAMVAATGTLLYRELKRARAVRRFFATFTHELKTPLASLRLQAESLAEELTGNGQSANKYLTRLIADTERLELQLENSLLLSSLDSNRHVHLEDVELQELVSNLAREVPKVEVSMLLDVETIRADRRALSTILRNLLHNTFVHGQASKVTVTSKNDGTKTTISVIDNGIGGGLSEGEIKRLGSIFYRPKGGSGNGIGLYLCKELMERMGGSVRFSINDPTGFRAQLVFPGGYG